MPGSNDSAFVRAAVALMAAVLLGVGAWWCNRVNTQLDELTEEAIKIRTVLEVQAGGSPFGG